MGATSNTFNTPGVTEHAIFLKEVCHRGRFTPERYTPGRSATHTFEPCLGQLPDASALRDRMLDAFESAALQDDPWLALA